MEIQHAAYGFFDGIAPTGMNPNSRSTLTKSQRTARKIERLHRK